LLALPILASSSRNLVAAAEFFLVILTGLSSLNRAYIYI
jgi:hypothetical protein